MNCNNNICVICLNSIPSSSENTHNKKFVTLKCCNTEYCKNCLLDWIYQKNGKTIINYNAIPSKPDLNILNENFDNGEFSCPCCRKLHYYNDERKFKMINAKLYIYMSPSKKLFLPITDITDIFQLAPKKEYYKTWLKSVHKFKDKITNKNQEPIKLICMEIDEKIIIEELEIKKDCDGDYIFFPLLYQFSNIVDPKNLNNKYW
jgi:hypothetical protein